MRTTCSIRPTWPRSGSRARARSSRTTSSLDAPTADLRAASSSYKHDSSFELGQQRFDHLSMHVRKPEVPSLKLEGQPCVIDAQALQDRGVKIVHVYRIFDDVVGEIVGFTVGDAALDA